MQFDSCKSSNKMQTNKTNVIGGQLLLCCWYFCLVFFYLFSKNRYLLKFEGRPRKNSILMEISMICGKRLIYLFL